MKRKLKLALSTLLLFNLGTVLAVPPPAEPVASLLVTGLDGGAGSTVGPGGAIYVTESKAGRIARVDPRSGEVTTFASGLPEAFVPRPGFNPDQGTIGGAMDIVFIGQ